MNKHTPGPWKVRTAYSNGEPVCYTIHLGQTSIADVTSLSEQNRVNATLIAAAPAMYAELVNGLGLLEASYHDMCDKYGNDSMQAEVVWDQVERTRNVIAQAEGR